MPTPRNTLGHFLAQKPMRVTPAKGYSRVNPQAVTPAVRWIRGPRPIDRYFVTHPMEMECEKCTFVLIEYSSDGLSLWELKFVNRHCPHHGKLAGPRECLG